MRDLGAIIHISAAVQILCGAGVGCTFSVAMAWEFFVDAHDGSILVLHSTGCSMTRGNHGH